MVVVNIYIYIYMIFSLYKSWLLCICIPVGAH